MNILWQNDQLCRTYGIVHYTYQFVVDCAMNYFYLESLWGFAVVVVVCYKLFEGQHSVTDKTVVFVGLSVVVGSMIVGGQIC